MKRSTLPMFAAALLAAGLYTGTATAGNAPHSDVAKSEASTKTITGKSACATCEGVTSDGHAILLIDKDGNRWVLLGEGKGYEAAHGVRKQGKTITATLAGDPVVKKDSDGKEYKEVKVSDVKVEA